MQDARIYYQFLLCNCYFRFGNTNSKHVIDIPVESFTDRKSVKTYIQPEKL